MSLDPGLRRGAASSGLAALAAVAGFGEAAGSAGVGSASAASAGGSSIAPISTPRCGRAALLAGEHRVGDRVAIEADRAAGVVIAGNREGDALGLTFESRIATTGMPSTLASLIASSSLLASITNMTSGNAAHVADAAERLSSSLSRSRVSWSTSFLVRPAVSPAELLLERS